MIIHLDRSPYDYQRPMIKAESSYAAGLDLGQAQGYSAMCLLGGVSDYAVRYLKRWPLGTSYPDIVKDVSRMMWHTLRGGRLAIDSTGCGRPVVDMFAKEQLPGKLWSVTITGGNGETVNGYSAHVSKVVLISRLQILLQERKLKIAADLPDAQVLISELETYRVKVTESANESFEARSGAHDDLVLALALAVWVRDRRRPTAGAI